MAQLLREAFGPHQSFQDRGAEQGPDKTAPPSNDSCRDLNESSQLFGTFLITGIPPGSSRPDYLRALFVFLFSLEVENTAVFRICISLFRGVEQGPDKAAPPSKDSCRDLNESSSTLWYVLNYRNTSWVITSRLSPSSFLAWKWRARVCVAFPFHGLLSNA
ncbi:hypothetical protein CEXT_611221 [Caerostris extrusa]|uniref:Uncharacterized protein n=1 Tax=Caerostris extrusa TaxID=172846 RepID=A0AAV4MH68_CAEEX|nr:hypothetical protein CEXT_611221 [Caerostris extrusa]